MGPVLTLPVALAAQRRRGDAWAAWLDDLPRRVEEVIDAWGLVVEAEPVTHGRTSLIVAVRDGDDRAGVVKFGFPDEESEHEHLALRRWGGRDAVRLWRADPPRRALLLERLERRDLAEWGDVAACEVVASLYGRLHVPASPQFRPLTADVERWADALARDARRVPMPRRLVEQALGLARELCAEERTVGTLIHADLHGQNVLHARDRGWVAIDPRPVSGDPHYEPEPMLRHRFEDYGALAGDSVRDGIRRRFHTLVDTAGLDEDRARAWVIVRAVLHAHQEIRQEAGDRDHVTRCVTIAKAVQD